MIDIIKKIIIILSFLVLVSCQVAENEARVDELLPVYESVLVVENEPLYKDTETFEPLGMVYKNSIYDVEGYLMVEDKTWLQITVGQGHEGWIDAAMCQQSALEPVEYTQVEKSSYVLEDFYVLGEQIRIKNLRTPNGYVRLAVDNKESKSDLILYKAETVDIKANYYDTLGRLIESLDHTVTIYDDQYTVYYQSPDASSKRIGVSDIIESTQAKKLIYVVASKALWVETVYDNQLVYYRKNRRDISRYTTFEDITIRYAQKETIRSGVQVDLSILNDGYIIYYGMSESELVHLDSGRSYLIKGDYVLSDDHQNLLIYKPLHHYEDGLNMAKTAVKVITLKDKDFKEVYKDINTYIGINNIESMESSFVFDAYNISIDDWHYAPETYHRKKIRLYDNGSWQEMLLHDDFDQSNPYVNVVVYAEPNLKSQELAQYSVDELDNIRFLDTYDISSGQLVLWYEVRLKDESMAYIFRPRLDNETGEVERDKAIYFTRSDKGLIKEEKLDFLTYGSTKVSDVLCFNDMYLMQSYYEGNNIVVYSRTSGDKVPLAITDFLSLSEDRSRLLGLDYLYGAESPVLKIYKVSPLGFELEYQLDSDIYFPWQPQWINNNEVSFISNQGNGSETFTLIYTDKWILESND